MQLFRTFETVREAEEYRRQNGDGGHIFVPHNAEDCIQFPVEMSADDVFAHRLTAGLCGKII